MDLFLYRIDGEIVGVRWYRETLQRFYRPLPVDGQHPVDRVVIDDPRGRVCDGSYPFMGYDGREPFGFIGVRYVRDTMREDIFPEFAIAAADKAADDKHQQGKNDEDLDYFFHIPDSGGKIRLIVIFGLQLHYMDLQLQGKTALILASSKGLGKACALALAREGAHVVITARNREALDTAADEIRSLGKGKVLAIASDVSDAAAAERLVAAVAAAFGRIDILVTNAGGPPFGPFETFDETAWQAAFELNLLSVVRFSRLVIPHMRKTGSGRIINIVSLSVRTFLAGSILSTSMRMGVAGMAKLLSDEVGPDHITVNNVAPGLILTDRVKDTLPPHAPEEEAQLLAERAKSIPVRRIGRPEELADLVAFLASPLAGYITGATIPIDGGAIRATAP